MASNAATVASNAALNNGNISTAIQNSLGKIISPVVPQAPTPAPEPAPAPTPTPDQGALPAPTPTPDQGALPSSPAPAPTPTPTPDQGALPAAPAPASDQGALPSSPTPDQGALPAAPVSPPTSAPTPAPAPAPTSDQGTQPATPTPDQSANTTPALVVSTDPSSNTATVVTSSGDVSQVQSSTPIPPNSIVTVNTDTNTVVPSQPSTPPTPPVSQPTAGPGEAGFVSAGLPGVPNAAATSNVTPTDMANAYVSAGAPGLPPAYTTPPVDTSVAPTQGALPATPEPLVAPSTPEVTPAAPVASPVTPEPTPSATGATGISSLPSSVNTPTDAFGTPGGSTAYNAAVSAGAPTTSPLAGISNVDTSGLAAPSVTPSPMGDQTINTTANLGNLPSYTTPSGGLTTDQASGANTGPAVPVSLPTNTIGTLTNYTGQTVYAVQDPSGISYVDQNGAAVDPNSIASAPNTSTPGLSSISAPVSAGVASSQQTGSFGSLPSYAQPAGGKIPGYLTPTEVSTGAPAQERNILSPLTQLKTNLVSNPTFSELNPNLLRNLITRAHGGSIHPTGHPEAKPGELVFKTGHYVDGPGDGQSDDIPAMLAKGEYVFDADTVAQLGNGSNEAGAELLDKFREAVRRHKRSAPDDKIPPKSKNLSSYIKEARRGSK